jgi:hypothetical protein
VWVGSCWRPLAASGSIEGRPPEERPVTEAEWWACEDPGLLLDAARGRATDRQLRLFAFACCRNILGFVPEGPCRDALDVALQFADGQASVEELAAARAAAIPVAGRVGPRQAAAWAATESTHPSALRAARAAATEAREQVRRESRSAEAEEARRQAGFLRDILGHPVDNMRTGPAQRLGLDPTVREIAEALYDGGPQEDMVALAEELERRGGVSLDILEHCRPDTIHIRGCWLLDLLLGHETGPMSAEEPPAMPLVTSTHWSSRAPSGGMPKTGWVVAGARSQLPEVPTWGEPGRTEGLRAAFAHYLGPKKFRRALRKAVDNPPGVGEVAQSSEWNAFVRFRPDLSIRPSEWPPVCTVCTAHGIPLVGRRVWVRAQRSDPGGGHNQLYLQARAAHFPHAHPTERPPAATEPGRFVWWCPDCQREWAEWAASLAPPAASQVDASSGASIRPPRDGCIVRVAGPIARGARVMTVALARRVFAEGWLDDGLSVIALRCTRAVALFYIAAAAGPEGGPGLDPDLPDQCEIIEDEVAPTTSAAR